MANETENKVIVGDVTDSEITGECITVSSEDMQGCNITGDYVTVFNEGEVVGGVSSVNGMAGAVVVDGSNINVTYDGETDTLNNTLSEKFSGLAYHNIPRVEPKDITSYIDDGSLWKRLNGTDGYGFLEDIYCGDYIKMSRAITVKDSCDGTVGSQYVTIAGINTLQGNGDTTYMMYNHLVMVPGQGFGGTQHFGRRRMNATHTTEGGYVGSEMHTTHIGAVAASGNTSGTINEQLYAEFGSHLKTTRELLTNSINATGMNRYGTAGGCSNGWVWYDCQAVLMSEVECYGSTVWSSSGYDTGNANHWLPLFQHSEKARNDRSALYWLKDIASSSYFCFASSHGLSECYGAANDNVFVRPRFVIA